MRTQARQNCDGCSQSLAAGAAGKSYNDCPVYRSRHTQRFGKAMNRRRVEDDQVIALRHLLDQLVQPRTDQLRRTHRGAAGEEYIEIRDPRFLDEHIFP
jgi:hypothetical protein